jgi:asparagine synthase (glutamine-hydrolysing)
MCGIAGEVAFDGSERSLGFLRAACEALRHRGPDEVGFYEEGAVGLGACRLRVIGLYGGEQPTFDSDRSVVCVFNGEIYNHHELRRRLERSGHRVGGTNDSHVVPALYRALGDAFVDELEGMFAIALYDKRTRELKLVTDRVGKKPIVYSRTEDGRVAFASEIAALLRHPDVDRTIDPVAVDQYLSYRVIPAPLTIFRGVRKVPPASIVTVRHGEEPTLRRYWRPEFTDALRDVPRDELVREVRTHLERAVDARLEAEVPLGAMLSGGLDSSLVVALVKRRVANRLSTFSVGFAQAAFDESAHAVRVARHFRTDHHAFEITPEDARRAIDPILRHAGEPYAFPSAIACYYMYRLASRHVTVVLTGDGSDEFLCGYDRYKRVAPDVGSDLADDYERILVDGVGHGTKAELYTPAFRESLPRPFPFNYLRARFRSTNGALHPLSRVMQVDCGFWLPDAQLVKVDRMSMAHSVEARHPLLDHKLLEYVMAIDPRHKLVDGNEKLLLKEVAKTYLPGYVLERRKQELAVPLEHWLSDRLRPLIQATLTSEAALGRGYFDPDALRAFVERFRPADSYALWTLFMLERWHQIFIDSNPSVHDPELVMV